MCDDEAIELNEFDLHAAPRWASIVMVCDNDLKVGVVTISRER
jgi:hypothetical protein